MRISGVEEYRPKFIYFIGYYFGSYCVSINKVLKYFFFWPLVFDFHLRVIVGKFFGNIHRGVATEIIIGLTTVYIIGLNCLIIMISMWLELAFVVIVGLSLLLAHISNNYLISDYMKMRKVFRIKFIMGDMYRFECKRNGVMYRNWMIFGRMSKWRNEK